jgi:hypothetical protein
VVQGDAAFVDVDWMSDAQFAGRRWRLLEHYHPGEEFTARFPSPEDFEHILHAHDPAASALSTVRWRDPRTEREVMTRFGYNPARDLPYWISYVDASGVRRIERFDDVPWNSGSDFRRFLRDQGAGVGVYPRSMSGARSTGPRQVAGANPLADLTDEEMDAAVESMSAPAVRGRSRPTIAGPEGPVRVPTRRPVRLDIDIVDPETGRVAQRVEPETGRIVPESAIPRRPGETLREAASRIERVIGQRISDTRLAPAWQRARDNVLRGRSVDSLGREGAIRAYGAVRDQFWQLVRTPEFAEGFEFLDEAGFALTDAPAPLLRVLSADIPVQEIRISLDHAFEKAIGENWRRALDADNLIFEFHNPNSFREIIQRRHRLR